jgi:hypothetical protein
MSTATDTALTTVYWGTNYAGQIVGVTDSNAANGVSQNPLAINCQLNVNPSDDLSSIIVANSGGNAKTIQYVNSEAFVRDKSGSMVKGRRGQALAPWTCTFSLWGVLSTRSV